MKINIVLTKGLLVIYWLRLKRKEKKTNKDIVIYIFLSEYAKEKKKNKKTFLYSLWEK